MRTLIFILCISSALAVTAQPRHYTTANAHSHNDYEQPNPFHEAYSHGFGSIEADIFLVPGREDLLVAHTATELATKKRSLDSLYLQPLLQLVRKCNGYPYADTSRKLQLLIDVKTEAVPTLARLVATLKKYPELIHCHRLQFVISGNRPDPGQFDQYPPFILFDGELGKPYSPQALAKITMMSTNLRSITEWKENGPLSEKGRKLLSDAIQNTHLLHKTVRFWNAPDDAAAWRVLMDLGVDYINTDHIAALTNMLRTAK